MKIVIDIDEEKYYTIKKHVGFYTISDWVNVCRAVQNGTPLPKGHGRLIDAEELKKDYPHGVDWEYPVNTNRYVVENIDNATTIIEADKESGG